MAIEDYTILSNGKAAIGTKPLYAFVFENFQPRMTFGEFIGIKFKTQYHPDGIWVETGGHRYKIILYDNSELEKYFMVTDFIITELKPTDSYSVNQPHFIALSAIDTYNNDCLASDSLLNDIVTSHLKRLKDEYNSYNGN
jgi:hypothetical protein